MRRVLILVVVVLVIAGVGAALATRYWPRSTASGTYRTGAARRTTIVASITATGTVVPVDVVDVGAQVNGQIAAFGKDNDGKPIDYRSEIGEGMVLARIDDALYAADVATSEALLAQSKAQVEVAQANRDQAKARLDQTERDWQRAQKLGQSAALAQADYDAARSNYEQAVANVAVTEASIGQAKAQVSIADASVLRSRRNLEYCTIKSPVSGVIIDKRVEIGQTVVASLNAPSLFLIAKDLGKMEVLVQVNEADIGSVRPGQEVAFTVDASPDRTFKGDVLKVRLNATMTQNVVTYTVEILTDNSDMTLIPYLTANVQFVVARKENVLAVPNAALRWSPRGAGGSGGSAPTAGAPGAGAGGAPGSGAGGAGAARGAGGQRSGQPGRTQTPQGPTVWVLQDGQPKAVPVHTGLTDGAMTEVDSPDLQEGAVVILGEEVAPTRGTTATGNTTNPFAPQIFRGGRGR